MIPLSWGKYALVDGVLYRRKGYSAENARNWVLVAVDPTAEPARREVPVGSVRFQEISPSATFRGTRLDALVFEEDGQVAFRLWTIPPDWPAEVPLERYGMPERAGDGFWTGKVSFSELTDYDDGLPAEWRPLLPSGGIGEG